MFFRFNPALQERLFVEPDEVLCFHAAELERGVPKAGGTPDITIQEGYYER